MPPKKKIRVAVIFGGPSSEREVSLSSGREVLKNLPRDKYELLPVDIKKDNQRFLKNKKDIDVAFLALHGKFGEDGRIQALLDKSKIPYTGSSARASALGMDKLKTRALVQKAGLKCAKLIKMELRGHTTAVSLSVISRGAEPRTIPRSRNGAWVNSKKFNLEKLNRLIEQKISYPCIVKPNQSGSSIGVSIIDSKKQLQKAIQSASKEDSCILIEEYIHGREMSCGVYGNTSQTQIKALPLTEIIPKSSDRFFSYDAKYIPGRTREVCPAPISKELTAEIQRLSKIAHTRLVCDGLTRSDFIIKENKAYFLEINTIPGITRTSICPQEAKVAGISFPKFLDLQIKLALSRTEI